MKSPLNDLRRIGNEVRRFISGKLPGSLGKITQEHFQASFDNEGFTDASLQKWPEVKRRQAERRPAERRPGKAGGKRRTDKILHDTGDLYASIKWDQDYDKQAAAAAVVIQSDLPYAQIHNQGGMAGRGKKVAIPRRQFMGPSKALNKKLEKEIIRGIDLIIKYK